MINNHRTSVPRRAVALGCERLEARELLSNLPPNFSETVVASGFLKPTAMEFAPDGRLFVALQDGRLRVLKNGQVLGNSFVDLNVDATGERGLLGVAFDPNFTSNQYIYVYYTVPGSPARNRLSRFTASGDVAAAGSEVVLLDLDPLSSDTRHNGGAIHFGPDGKLYVAVGDNKVGANAQSLTSLMGKILRINPDGTIPTDNPYYSQTTGADRAIWAIGLRNPYTFAFGTDTQGAARMLINDVGENTYEKVNPGLPGANYGWPNTENATGSAQYTNPLHVYDHGASNGNPCAITGGTFYNPGSVQFPSSYVGTYFFSDFCGDWIRQLDASTKTVTTFATQLPGGTVDLDVDSSGSLYYLAGAASSNGRVVRIDYSTTTPPPIGDPPRIDRQPASVTVAAGLTASFSVTASGSGNFVYQWQRNGRDIQGAVLPTLTLPNVRASDNGATFSVLVSNAWGSTSSAAATLAVVAAQPPVPSITSPAGGFLYAGGQTIGFSGGALDPQDGTIPDAGLSWKVERSDSRGVRTVVATGTGSSGSFVVPQSGDLGLNVFYRIALTATDSSGLSATTFVDVNPQVVNLTLASQPGGLPIVIDGQTLTTPTSIRAVAGMIRQLQAPADSIAGGVIYAFRGWSDGATESARSIVLPGADSSVSSVYDSVGIVPYVTIRSAALTVGRGAVRNVALSFDGPIDAASARSRNSYWLVMPGRDRRLGTRDDRRSRFRAVSYNAATNTAILAPASRIRARQAFAVIASGSGSRGMVVDIYNRPIDGDRDGQPGGDALVSFGPASPSRRAAPQRIRSPWSGRR